MILCPRWTPILMYLESFCHSPSAEEENSYFIQMLEDVDINQQQQPTMLNLDSGQVETVHEHAWDRDLNEWLDNLIEELDQEAELESFENDIDFTDSIEDMTNDEWGNVWNDVINNFHSNLFRHFFLQDVFYFFVKQQRLVCIFFFEKSV